MKIVHKIINILIILKYRMNVLCLHPVVKKKKAGSICVYTQTDNSSDNTWLCRRRPLTKNKCQKSAAAKFEYLAMKKAKLFNTPKMQHNWQNAIKQ